MNILFYQCHHGEDLYYKKSRVCPSVRHPSVIRQGKIDPKMRIKRSKIFWSLAFIQNLLSKNCGLLFSLLTLLKQKRNKLMINDYSQNPRMATINKIDHDQQK